MQDPTPQVLEGRSRSSSRRRVPSGRRARPSLENLESRVLLTGRASGIPAAPTLDDNDIDAVILLRSDGVGEPTTGGAAPLAVIFGGSGPAAGPSTTGRPVPMPGPSPKALTSLLNELTDDQASLRVATILSGAQGQSAGGLVVELPRDAAADVRNLPDVLGTHVRGAFNPGGTADLYRIGVGPQVNHLHLDLALEASDERAAGHLWLIDEAGHVLSDHPFGRGDTQFDMNLPPDLLTGGNAPSVYMEVAPDTSDGAASAVQGTYRFQVAPLSSTVSLPSAMIPSLPAQGTSRAISSDFGVGSVADTLDLPWTAPVASESPSSLSREGDIGRIEAPEAAPGAGTAALTGTSPGFVPTLPLAAAGPMVGLLVRGASGTSMVARETNGVDFSLIDLPGLPPSPASGDRSSMPQGAGGSGTSAGGAAGVPNLAVFLGPRRVRRARTPAELRDAGRIPLPGVIVRRTRPQIEARLGPRERGPVVGAPGEPAVTGPARRAHLLVGLNWITSLAFGVALPDLVSILERLTRPRLRPRRKLPVPSAKDAEETPTGE